MREHLYRGKREDSGEWVYGYFAKYMDCQQQVYSAILVFDEETGDVYSNGITPVEADSVGEYTGLTDKKGKKIFEGDRVIAKFWSDWGECYEKSDGEVMYDNGKYIIYISHYCMKLDLCNHPEIEVIGNTRKTLDKK